MEIGSGYVRITIPVSTDMEQRLEKLSDAQVQKIEETVAARFPSVLGEISGYIANILVTDIQAD